MADNRMWLVNDLTGQRVLMAKHSHDAWFIDWSDLDQNLTDAFNAEVKFDHPDLTSFPWRVTCYWRIEYERQQPSDPQLKPEGGP